VGETRVSGLGAGEQTIRGKERDCPDIEKKMDRISPKKNYDFAVRVTWTGGFLLTGTLSILLVERAGFVDLEKGKKKAKLLL